MSEADGADDGLRPLATASQAIVPVEVHLHGLHRRRDIAQPQRAPGAVAQQVHAQVPQLVLRSHDAHLDPAALRDLRVSEHFLQRMIGQIGKSPLQVQQQPPRPEAGQRRLGGGVLLGSHEKIDVAVRPQAWLRIQASDGPAFREKRLDAGRPAAVEGLGDRLLVHAGFEGVHAIGVVQLSRTPAGAATPSRAHATSPVLRRRSPEVARRSRPTPQRAKSTGGGAGRQLPASTAASRRPCSSARCGHGSAIAAGKQPIRCSRVRSRNA